MADPTGLRQGPLGPNTVHVCVDMQRMFSDDTPWSTPWMRRVLPRVVTLCEARPERTVFTRFLPPARADDVSGMWRQYYRRWPQMTREVIDPDLIRLLPELELFTPPAMVFDKSRYSPWIDGRLDSLLRGLDADTLIISGGETEVCVLSTIFGAVDLGYRVVVAADGLFSSVSDLHSAVQTLLHDRFSQQVESVLIEEIIDGRE